MNNDFSQAKIGDRCWYIYGGPEKEDGTNSVVVEANTDFVWIKKDTDTTQVMSSACLHANGKRHFDDPLPSLYWSRPQIVAPPRPKRMKKVKVEVRPFRNSSGNHIDSENLYAAGLKYCGPIQVVEIEVSDD